VPKDITRSNVHGVGEPPPVPATDRNHTPLPVTASPANPYAPLSVGDAYGAWRIIAVHARKAILPHKNKFLGFVYGDNPDAIFNGLVYQYDMQCACGTIRYKQEYPRQSQRCCHCRSCDYLMQCPACYYSYYTQRPRLIPCPRCKAPANEQADWKPRVYPWDIPGPVLALTDDNRLYILYPDGQTDYFDDDESGECA
jgi:hypothetical protein